jgi:hypothetical protein
MAIDACLNDLADYQKNNTDYEQQHKGSPFYVMGYAAYGSHDYSGASLFFDAAASADITAFGAGADKPALNFLQLIDRGQEVLASGIIRDLVAETQVYLDDYNMRQGRQPLSLDELRKRFLTKILSDNVPEKRALVTTFLSFIAEAGYRKKLMPLISEGSREPFLVHLFRGCVLFESLLKENPTQAPQHETLGRILGELAVPLGGNYEKKGSATFDDVMSNLRPQEPIGYAILAATRLRNTTGHKISWGTTHLSVTTYDEAIMVIVSSCLHVISKLYP